MDLGPDLLFSSILQGVIEPCYNAPTQQDFEVENNLGTSEPEFSGKLHGTGSRGHRQPPHPVLTRNVRPPGWKRPVVLRAARDMSRAMAISASGPC